MADRAFRTDESIVEERITRDMVPTFLESVGFIDVVDKRTGHSQTVRGRLPGEPPIAMRVRLCWRRSGKKKRATYSAAQLVARIKENDWEGTIEDKVARDKASGVSHLLLVQRDGTDIVAAALLPIDQVLPVWIAQRDAGEREIAKGTLRSNPAKNGLSPTLYLQLDKAPAIPDALWKREGVVDLAALPKPEVVPDVRGGFGSYEDNRLAEVAAVGVVRSRFEQDGWVVRSVERDGCGFDLDCRRGSEVQHVEVKGLRGVQRAFSLTAGELRCAATDPAFALIVVNAVLTKTPIITRYSGAELHDQFDFAPLQYRAVPKGDQKVAQNDDG